MGIGTRRDPLDANAWYVRAADQGDERAKHRLAAIRTAASGGAEESQSMTPAKNKAKKSVAHETASPKPAGQDENAKDNAGTKEGEEMKDKTKKKWGIF